MGNTFVCTLRTLGIEITDRAMQLELAKLNKLGLIKPEGKGRTLTWFVTN